MRVAYVTSSYYPQVGGVDIHVKNIAEEFAGSGDNVTVLTHRINQTLQTEEVYNGVRIMRFPLVSSLPNYAFSPALFTYLRRHASDFDVIHSHSYHTVVGQASIGIGLPFVFTPHYHGTGHTPFRALLHHIYRPAGARLFNSADAVICVSAAERDLVVTDFPATRQKVSIIPNGTKRRSISEQQSTTAPSADLVLTVGRIERYKNLDLVIKAFHALPTGGTLVIVGDGPDRDRLEELSRNFPSPEAVRFAGRISDAELDDLLARATVVTSASDHEAFGLVLAEGLSAGARVVASDIPAHREVGRLAGDEPPIEFVDVKNLPQYTRALKSALSKGRVASTGISLPSWTDVASETRTIYSRLLDKEPRVNRAR